MAGLKRAYALTKPSQSDLISKKSSLKLPL